MNIVRYIKNMRPRTFFCRIWNIFNIGVLPAFYKLLSDIRQPLSVCPVICSMSCRPYQGCMLTVHMCCIQLEKFCKTARRSQNTIYVLNHSVMRNIVVSCCCKIGFLRACHYMVLCLILQSRGRIWQRIVEQT